MILGLGISQVFSLLLEVFVDRVKKYKLNCYGAIKNENNGLNPLIQAITIYCPNSFSISSSIEENFFNVISIGLADDMSTPACFKIVRE